MDEAGQERWLQTNGRDIKMKYTKVQLTNADVCEIETHALTGHKVRARWTGEGTILGKRAGVDARKRFAFVIQHGDVVKLISRASFTPLNPDKTEMIVFRTYEGYPKEMPLRRFLAHYEPDLEFIPNTKRDDGLWHYWLTKRGGKRVRITTVRKS